MSCQGKNCHCVTCLFTTYSRPINTSVTGGYPSLNLLQSDNFSPSNVRAIRCENASFLRKFLFQFPTQFDAKKSDDTAARNCQDSADLKQSDVISTSLFEF